MTTTAPIHCGSCGVRIGRRGKHWLLYATSLVLCHACAHSTRTHTDLFPTCQIHTTCANHAHVVTRAGAAWLMSAAS